MGAVAGEALKCLLYFHINVKSSEFALNMNTASAHH